jgi:hypothetical protein
MFPFRARASCVREQGVRSLLDFSLDLGHHLALDRIDQLFARRPMSMGMRRKIHVVRPPSWRGRCDSFLLRLTLEKRSARNSGARDPLGGQGQ